MIWQAASWQLNPCSLFTCLHMFKICFSLLWKPVGFCLCWKLRCLGQSNTDGFQSAVAWVSKSSGVHFQWPCRSVPSFSKDGSLSCLSAKYSRVLAREIQISKFWQVPSDYHMRLFLVTQRSFHSLPLLSLGWDPDHRVTWSSCISGEYHSWGHFWKNRQLFTNSPSQFIEKLIEDVHCPSYYFPLVNSN